MYQQQQQQQPTGCYQKIVLLLQTLFILAIALHAQHNNIQTNTFVCTYVYMFVDRVVSEITYTIHSIGTDCRIPMQVVACMLIACYYYCYCQCHCYSIVVVLVVIIVVNFFFCALLLLQLQLQHMMLAIVCCKFFLCFVLLYSHWKNLGRQAAVNQRMLYMEKKFFFSFFCPKALWFFYQIRKKNSDSEMFINNMHQSQSQSQS